jgi:hypothetical protein
MNYEGPHYNYDGLNLRNVEWYSGGMHLTTVRHACNMQCIVLLHPHKGSMCFIEHGDEKHKNEIELVKVLVLTSIIVVLMRLL